MFLTWLLAGYGWFFVHRPFEVWPILGAIHIERLYMIGLCLVWMFWPKKTFSYNRLIIGFIVFWIAIVVAWAFSPYRNEGTKEVEDYFKQVIFFLLVITSIRGEKPLKVFVTLFLVTMGLYIGHSFREYFNGRHVWAMGTYRMIGVDATYSDPNSFAATILYSMPVLVPLLIHYKKLWQRVLFLGYALLGIAAILLTGSRSGFAGLILLLILLIAMSKYRKTLLIIVALGGILIWGNMRGDLKNRYLTLVDSSYGDQGAESSARGRTQGFQDGMRLLSQRPIFGYGPGSFGSAAGHGFQAHNLYGQVMGELGGFGLVALAFILFHFFLNWKEARKLRLASPQNENSFSYHICISTGLAIVLLLFMGWGGHNLYRYTWLWYGSFQIIALGQLRKPETESEPSETESMPV